MLLKLCVYVSEIITSLIIIQYTSTPPNPQGGQVITHISENRFCGSKVQKGVF